MGALCVRSDRTVIDMPGNWWCGWVGLNVSILYRYNTAADCSISLKFCTKFDHVTADTLKLFMVKGSEVKVTC